MLPILIYEPDAAARQQLLDGLGALDADGAPRTRVSLSTGSMDGMRRAIEAEGGITLALLGVPEGRVAETAALGEMLMRKNRDSYAVYCLHDAGALEELFAHCMRPAGILTAPWTDRALSGCLKRILRDYESQTVQGDEGDSLVIEANSTTYRLGFGEIMYLEALDKLLTIHTERQSITVRRSLSALADALPESFVRCHRAYVVNSRFIDRVDYAGMMLTLRNGDTLPLSRGQRAAVKQLIEAQKGAST